MRRLLLDQGAKHWKGYVFAFAMMGLIALTTSLSAWIIGRIVDKIFVGRNLKAVWEITAAIVAASPGVMAPPASVIGFAPLDFHTQ